MKPRAIKNFSLLIILMQISLICTASAKSSIHPQKLKFIKTDKSFALINNDRTVWQFNYGHHISKPYFHPVALTDGTVLTWDAPADHPWHHGLWFSWKSINGINYWEEDRKTGKSKGTTSWDDVKIQKQSDGSAEISMDLSYHEPGKPAVLTEKRKMTLSAPDQSGVYWIDWTSEFTAMVEKVELGRTALPWEKNGKSYGGYAGLSFRACKDVKDAQYTSTFASGVPLSNGNYRFKDIAVEYSGITCGKTFGVAILDHSENLNYPSPWYLNDGNPMDYFSPASLLYKEYTMSKGEKLTLRYRIIIHPERWNSNKLKKEQKFFAVDPNTHD